MALLVHLIGAFSNHSLFIVRLSPMDFDRTFDQFMEEILSLFGKAGESSEDYYQAYLWN